MTINTADLFAGVGGFRLALEGNPTTGHPKAGNYANVFANQWEPDGQPTQHQRQTPASRPIHRMDDGASRRVGYLTGDWLITRAATQSHRKRGMPPTGRSSTQTPTRRTP